METRIILVMIVKNETKNIRECIASAVPWIDAICISDTGSSDDTVSIIQEFAVQKPTKVVTDFVFKNFGFNRTASIRAAEKFALEQNWSLSECRAMLLDADCRILFKKSKSDVLSELDTFSGAMVNHTSLGTSYCRLNFLRMSENWNCIGSTHEFWTSPNYGSTQNLTDVVSIQELNTGGCRSDKDERDIRLLENELLEVHHGVIQDLYTMGRRLFYLGRSHLNSQIGCKVRALQYLEQCTQVTKFPEEAFEARLLLFHSLTNNSAKDLLSQGLKHAFEGLKEMSCRPELFYHVARLLAWKLESRIAACELLLIAIRNSIPTPIEALKPFWIDCAMDVSGCSKEDYLSRTSKLFLQVQIVTFGLFEELAICSTWTDTKKMYQTQGQRCNMFLLDHAEPAMKERARLRNTKYFHSN